MARALDSKDEGKQHSKREDLIYEAHLKRLYEIYETLDLKILAVHEVAETVNKKLTLLIKLLQQTLSLDPLLSAGQQQAPPKEEHSYQFMQARVDKHVLDQGLDIVSRFGMPP